MRLHIKQLYCNFLLLLLALLLAFNVYVLNRSYNQSRQQHKSESLVSEIIVKKDGLEKLNLAEDFLSTNEISFKFLTDPIINEHKYNFINGPRGVCTNKTIDLLVAIQSSVINFDRRKLARRIRFTPPPVGIIYLFFMGKTFHLASLQKRVEDEVKRYGDIVQVDFEDSPQNQSLLSVSILKWINNYCPDVKYVVKKIDDARMNLARILQAIRHKEDDYRHFVMGNSSYLIQRRIRNEVSRYYMSVSGQMDIPFVMYIQGPVYGFPGKTAVLLYQVSLRAKLFWRENVYITGICAQRANLPVFFDKSFFYTHSIYKI